MPPSSAHRIDNILRAVCAEAWAIQAGKLEAILEFLTLRADGIILSDEQIAERIGGPLARAGDPPSRATAAPNAGGVAVLPLVGIITHRAPMVGNISGGGGASTDAFGRIFEQALADEQVRAILIDVDSPGGTVSGVAELRSRIFQARGRKPIVAVANATAASAAYWIASAADEVSVTPSGLVGAIGVYTVTTDTSEKDRLEGVKRTVISAGKFKAEGADGGPLTDEATAALKSHVETLYGMFVSDVAANRGVTASAVREGFGQGRGVLAKQAVTDGLADRVETFDEALARISNPRRAATIGRSRRADLELRKLALEERTD